jgi:hypothetical protein
MTKKELALLERYLDAVHNSSGARDALADLIELVDAKSKEQ